MFRIAHLVPLVLGAVAVLAGASVPLAASTAPLGPPPQIRGVDAASAVPGRYLVKLKDTAALSAQDVDARARALNDAHGGEIDQVWRHALRGFVTTMSRDEAQSLAAEPEVEYVLADQRLAGADLRPAQTPPGLTQSPVSWGLDRIDQHAQPMDNKYSYDESAGEDVHAYIMSTGINVANPEFGGRAIGGGNFVNDGNSSSSDCHGGGTRLAGFVGGTTYGVAKKVTLVGVRTGDCHNIVTLSALASGINWLVGNVELPAVVLLPVNDYCVDLMGKPIPCDPNGAALFVQLQEQATAAGLPVIGMAGDSAQDTCAVATGAAPHTIYVGSTAEDDTRADHSNFGPCVTMFAPGEGVTTTDKAGGSFVGSSTAAAAAYVAGTAALFAGKPEFDGASPAQIRDELVQHRATPDAIEGLIGDTPNLLLFTGPPGLFTIGDSTSVSLRGDGRLQIFGVNAAGSMYHRIQSSPGTQNWSNWTQSKTDLWLSIGSKQGPDGRITLLGLTKTGELAVRQEAAAGTNTWFNWVPLSGVPSGKPIARATVANNLSNRLQIFVTDTEGRAYFRSQLAIGSRSWSTWSTYGMPVVRDITAVNQSDGRIEVFALDDAGQLWRTAQLSNTDTNWGPVTKLSGFGMVSISAVRAANGKITLVALDSGGGPWYRAQNNQGTWGDWLAMRSMRFGQISAETNANGTIHVIGVDYQSRIWQTTQITQNENNFTSWFFLDGTLRP